MYVSKTPADDVRILLAIIDRGISKHPDVQGGAACIKGTRLPVWVIENYQRLGGTDVQLFQDYPFLVPDDLTAAQLYTIANREEIDCAIQENEQG